MTNDDPGASVRIVEVGPRDGLQNETDPIPTAAKIAFIDALSQAGHSHIEVTSMVRPDRVPQLADAEKVFRGIEKTPGVRYTVLVPNERGLDRALAVGARSIAVFTAASERFSKKNTGMTLSRSLQTIAAMAERARREKVLVRAYVSTCFVCPYSGTVAPENVSAALRHLRDLGINAISIGDTMGAATPPEVEQLLDVVEAKCPTPNQANPFSGLALHLHDTHGRALENVHVGLERGIREFDTSARGLGGCPFAPGAPGNLSTESLLEFLDGRGLETSVDLELQKKASVHLGE